MAMVAATQASEILLDYFEAPVQGLDTKSTPTDLVSDADRAAEKFISDFIKHERPEDGVLGEEGAGRPSKSGLTWVVDPLDGTVNFLFNIPVWCVSIAIEDAEGGLVGVIYDPNKEE